MKEIRMDYETYEKELETQYENGKNDGQITSLYSLEDKEFLNALFSEDYEKEVAKITSCWKPHRIPDLREFLLNIITQFSFHVKYGREKNFLKPYQEEGESHESIAG